MNNINRVDAKTALKLNLKELREKKAMSQGHLAELIGISQKSLSEIETGKRWPMHDTLVKLATALDVEETDLLVDPGMVASLKYHAGRK